MEIMSACSHRVVRGLKIVKEVKAKVLKACRVSLHLNEFAFIGQFLSRAQVPGQE